MVRRRCWVAVVNQVPSHHGEHEEKPFEQVHAETDPQGMTRYSLLNEADDNDIIIIIIRCMATWHKDSFGAVSIRRTPNKDPRLTDSW